jgi:hypothetical protein
MLIPSTCFTTQSHYSPSWNRVKVDDQRLTTSDTVIFFLALRHSLWVRWFSAQARIGFLYDIHTKRRRASFYTWYIQCNSQSKRYADSFLPATITAGKTTDVVNTIMYPGASGTSESSGFDIYGAIATMVWFTVGTMMRKKRWRKTPVDS